MVYGTTANVAGLLPRGGAVSGDFGANDRPSVNNVTDFLDRTSARIDGRIRAAGYDPATASANGLKILTDAVVSYVAGRVERIWAALAGANPNDHGKDLMQPLLEMIEDLKTEPASVAHE